MSEKSATSSETTTEPPTQADSSPRSRLVDIQVDLLDRLQELGLAYAQDDREKAWLDDMCILRYLRAREWKLDKAEKMLKATMDWRREWGVEDLRREDVILSLELKSLYRNGVDKQGRPVMFIKPVYNPNTVEYRLKSLIYSLEEAIQSMDAANGVEKICLIADFEAESKLQKRSADGSTVGRTFLNFLQNHYPERLGICFALNPPWYIRLVFTLLSPFMDPVTKKKIHFLNGNAEHIKKALLEHIDADQLENCYGGNREVGPEPDLRDARQNPPAPTELEEIESPNVEDQTPKKKRRKKSKKSGSATGSTTGSTEAADDDSLPEAEQVQVDIVA